MASGQGEIAVGFAIVWSGGGAPSTEQWEALTDGIFGQPVCLGIDAASYLPNGQQVAHRTFSTPRYSQDGKQVHYTVEIDGQLTKNGLPQSSVQTLRTLVLNAGGVPNEIDNVKQALILILDDECFDRGITGNNWAQFEGLLTAYAQEVAVGLGYSPAQAANLSALVWNLNDRYLCFAGNCAYMVSNIANWEPAE
jgi:hypothetical protein